MGFPEHSLFSCQRLTRTFLAQDLETFSEKGFKRFDTKWGLGRRKDAFVFENVRQKKGFLLKLSTVQGGFRKFSFEMATIRHCHAIRRVICCYDSVFLPFLTFICLSDEISDVMCGCVVQKRGEGKAIACSEMEKEKERKKKERKKK